MVIDLSVPNVGFLTKYLYCRKREREKQRGDLQTGMAEERVRVQNFLFLLYVMANKITFVRIRKKTQIGR